MNEDIVSLFGPDEPQGKRAVKKRTDKPQRRKLRFPQDPEPDCDLESLRPARQDEMDHLLGLFDPSLEDETTSNIDELNEISDCLLNCYKVKSITKSINRLKNKRHTSPFGINSFRSQTPDELKNGVVGHINTSKNDLGTESLIQKSQGETGITDTFLNNASSINDTSKRRSSINMLDRYNDWTTQRQPLPRSCTIVNNSSSGKNVNVKTNNNSIKNSYNKDLTNRKSNSINKKKSSQRNNNKSLSGRCKVRPVSVNNASASCNVFHEDETRSKLINVKGRKLTKAFNLNKVNENHGNCDTNYNEEIKLNNVEQEARINELKNSGNYRCCSRPGNYCISNSYVSNNNSTCSCSSDISNGEECLECCKISSNCEGIDTASLPDHLPSEPQEGNIEYKLKLLNPNQERFRRLVSQMQWRLREGLGEAIYEIGVEDSGLLLGLTPYELSLSLSTLRRMARQLGASLTVLREKTLGDGGRTVAEVLVRKVPDDQSSIELRVAVLGSSDVGKSTLLGVLTRGELDNGRGCARLNVFRHRHEVYSGKTSSISIQTMGFDSHGNVVDGTCTRSRDYDDEDICAQSSKIVNFIDLAGDERYLHTTVFGLSGYCPHYAMLVVSAFCGLSPMASQHLSLARAVDVPLLLVVTKTDLATAAQLQATLSSLTAALAAPPYKKVPLVVRTADDAITAGGSCHGHDHASSSVVPIFLVSSVTGEGLNLLKKFLFVLPPKMTMKEREKSEQEVAQFQVDEVFHVDERVVVGGLLTAGVIPNGTSLLLGPFDDCSFLPVSVESIHRNKVPCRVVYAGQSASLCLAGTPHAAGGGTEGRVRKGMKLLAPETKPAASYYFQAWVRVVSGERGVGRGCELTAHIGNVRQTVVVAGVLGRDRIRVTDSQPCSVLLRFLRQPELVSVGARLLLRQADVQGVGHLQQVFGEPPYTRLKTR